MPDTGTTDEIEQARRDVYESPAAWFIEMMIARKRDDFARAAAAQRQLKRLGVIVRFGRRSRTA